MQNKEINNTNQIIFKKNIVGNINKIKTKFIKIPVKLFGELIFLFFKNL